jgi:hypothetical protein
MQDIETIVKENNAYYEGAKAAEAGEARDTNPYIPARGRLQELWWRAYDKVVDKGDV